MKLILHEDTLLINWTQNFLGLLEGSGLLKEMHRRWLDGGPWINELPFFTASNGDPAVPLIPSCF